MTDERTQTFTVKGVSIAFAQYFSHLARVEADHEGKSRADVLEEMIEHYAIHLLGEKAAKRGIQLHLRIHDGRQGPP